MIDTCTWDNPGVDRYSGTVAAAIAAYRLPIATQRALIEAFERRDFDTVVIDRETIRGKDHAYEPELRGMHFGGRGRICGNVTRAGWSAEHVETALVFCADGECIAYPAVCGNVARVRRIAVPDRPAQPAMVPPGAEPAPELIAAPPVEPRGFARPIEPGGAGYAPYPMAFAWPVPPIYIYGAPGYPVGVPVAAIPEPESYLLILAGLAAVSIWRKRAVQQAAR